MKDKLHVLTIPTWYPIGYDKLMGVYHKDFCNALNKRDDCYSNILYIQRHRLKKPWEYIFDKKWKEIDEGAYHTYIHTMLNLGPVSVELQLKRYKKELERAFKRYVKINGYPDIIHADVIVPAGYAAASISKKYNIPLLIQEHTYLSCEKLLVKEPYKSAANEALKQGMYTAVSHDLARKIEKITPNVKVLPNSVDLNIFKDVNGKTPNGRIDLITVCALRPDKGIDIEIEALKILKEEYKKDNFHLNIVGDGDQMSYYKDCLKKSAMEDYVSFLGKKDRNEVAKLISNSDILVMPSFVESFGIPGIEALACGVPVCATKSGAPEEYMDQNCGELCDAKDSMALAKALNIMIEKISSYDRAYLKSVANRFSEKEVTDLAMKYYKELPNR